MLQLQFNKLTKTITQPCWQQNTTEWKQERQNWQSQWLQPRKMLQGLDSLSSCMKDYRTVMDLESQKLDCRGLLSHCGGPPSPWHGFLHALSEVASFPVIVGYWVCNFAGQWRCRVIQQGTHMSLIHCWIIYCQGWALLLLIHSLMQLHSHGQGGRWVLPAQVILQVLHMTRTHLVVKMVDSTCHSVDWCSISSLCQ